MRLRIFALAVLVCALTASAQQPAQPAPAAPAAPAASRDFSLPVKGPNGDVVAQLVLGKTTLDEVLALFGGDKKEDVKNASVPFRIGRASQKTKHSYQAPGTNYALYFDKNKRLSVVLDTAPEFAGETKEQIRKRFPNLSYGDRQPLEYFMETRLSNCVSLAIFFRLDDVANRAGYGYTCGSAAAK